MDTDENSIRIVHPKGEVVPGNHPPADPVCIGVHPWLKYDFKMKRWLSIASAPCE
jgi:hypothetical protein